MRGTRAGMRGLATALLLVAGCWKSGPPLKPPPQPEKLAVPPTTESRWSQPIEYPRGTLFTDTIQKKDDAPSQMGGPSHMGSSVGGPPHY